MRRAAIIHPDVGFSAALAVVMRSEYECVSLASTPQSGLRLLPLDRLDLIVARIDPRDPPSRFLLRALGTRFRTCPTLIICGSDENARLIEDRDLCIAGFLAEPVSFQDVLERLRLLAAWLDQPLELKSLSSAVSHAIDFLATNYHRKLSIVEITRTVGVSASHLEHLFKIETGASLTNYLRDVRVEVAKQFLSESPDKLELIAERAGFCDAAHLSREFRRQTGTRPGQFRKLRMAGDRAVQNENSLIH